jgi:serine protease Do
MDKTMKDNYIKKLTFLSFFLMFIGIVLCFVIAGWFLLKPSQNKEKQQTKELMTSTFLPANEQIQKVDEIDSSRRNAIVMAAHKAGPAVVSVGATITRSYREVSPFYDDFFDSFFRDIFPSRKFRQTIPRLGSGVIVNRQGYVLTNHHVIEDGEEFFLTLSDGRQFEGELLGADRYIDIAVLKIAGKNLPYAELGDSDDLIIGEWAIAIGNPFGNVLKDPQPTVTVGVISAFNRSFSPAGEQEQIYQNMIQTDAAINPGNSGGPLVNAEGKVIGINTFIVTKSGGSLGIGFAIPINKCRDVLKEVIQYGRVRQVWFGFQLQEMTPLYARSLGLKEAEGFIVVYVERRSPAWQAGLQKGDILLEVDGKSLKNVADVRLLLLSHRVGDKLTLIVQRNGRRLTLILNLKERPD